jgi:hypothetical protein
MWSRGLVIKRLWVIKLIIGEHDVLSSVPKTGRAAAAVTVVNFHGKDAPGFPAFL